MNIMWAPQGPGATFGVNGNTYVANQYQLLVNVAQSDVPALQAQGCSVAVPRNTTMTRAPLPSDDFTAGFNVGSQWSYVNGSLITLYECSVMSSSPGGAVWVSVTGAQGPQGPVGPPIAFDGTWTSTSSYAQGVGVAFNNSTYISLQPSNLNHVPSSSPTFWQLLGLNASAANPIIHVFLIGGQSNAVGSFADPTLSPTVPAGVYQYYNGTISAANDPVGNAVPSSAWPAFGIEYFKNTGVQVLFVPAAVGGTDQSYEAGVSTANWDTMTQGSWGSANTLAPALIAAASAAMAAAANAGYNPILRGILWCQGENDADAIGASSSFPINDAVLVTGGPYNAGTTAITVSTSTGLVTGQSAYIGLTAGSSFTSIITVSGTNITLSTPVPAGQQIPTGAPFNIFRAGQYIAAFQRMAVYYRSTAINGTVYPELPIFISTTGGSAAGDNFGYAAIRQAQDLIAMSDPYTRVVFRGAVEFIADGIMQNPVTTYTASASAGIMAVLSAPATGGLLVQPGAAISGTGVTSTTTIGQYFAGGGVGGTGHYNLSPTQTFSPTLITQSGSNLHYKQEGYNKMGRGMARGVIDAQDRFIPQLFNVLRVALGGALTTGDTLAITLTGGFTGSPWELGPYTISNTDTFGGIAQTFVGLATIDSPNMVQAGIATAAETTTFGSVISFYYPAEILFPDLSVAVAWTGAGTELDWVTAGQSAFGESPDVSYTRGNVAVGGGGLIGPDLFDVFPPQDGTFLSLGINSFAAGVIVPQAANVDNNVLRLGNSQLSSAKGQRVGLLLQPSMELYTQTTALYGAAIIASHDQITGRGNVVMGGYEAGVWQTAFTVFYDGSVGVGVGTVNAGLGNLVVGGSAFIAESSGGIPAGGNAAFGIAFCGTNTGLYIGSGPPTLVAGENSLYIRTDGNSASTRLYGNTNGSTSWTPFISAS